MFNDEVINELVRFISYHDGIGDKGSLSNLVKEKFGLTKDRSVLYGENFAIRFCQSKSQAFGNTVLSLSTLQKYDKKPMIICIVTPDKNDLMLANTTFLKKISHSSQELRMDNIRGSFNGSDIIREFGNIKNAPENFNRLYAIHSGFTFEDNLERLVASTNNIQSVKGKFSPSTSERAYIIDSVSRAAGFLASKDYNTLALDLYNRVKAVESEIAIAAFIDNVNLRGRIIEYLITSNGGNLKEQLLDSLVNSKPIPGIFVADGLGDYTREFDSYVTETDIKTKVLFLQGNPKGYNIDKLLRFLSIERSVYLIYIVAIDEHKTISTKLCSMYNPILLNGTRIYKHWAGRNSRGVTQFEGEALKDIVFDYDHSIDQGSAMAFIEDLLSI